MKKLLIIAFSLFVTSVFAQMYPKQYALIKGSVITGGKTDWIPYVNNENMVFSQNGNYLFIAHAKQKEEGNQRRTTKKLRSQDKGNRARLGI